MDHKRLNFKVPFNPSTSRPSIVSWLHIHFIFTSVHHPLLPPYLMLNTGSSSEPSDRTSIAPHLLVPNGNISDRPAGRKNQELLSKNVPYGPWRFASKSITNHSSIPLHTHAHIHTFEENFTGKSVNICKRSIVRHSTGTIVVRRTFAITAGISHHSKSGVCPPLISA